MMKKTIIGTTDFSDSANNALNYACAFAKNHNFNILLTRIYTFPASYAAEGPSLATINDFLADDWKMLKEKLEQVKTNYPEIYFEAEMMTGGFLKSLQQLKLVLDPEMIIIGAGEEDSDRLPWNDGWLKALVTVSCPVLIIPKHISYKPIINIAFASDNKKEYLPELMDSIKKFVRLSGAYLFIVHVTPQIVLPEENKSAAAFKEIFSDLKSQYFSIENKMVTKGLAEFIRELKIDLLIVVTYKHGLWYDLFNKSHRRSWPCSII